ncbi:MAG: flippase-like domain-containing protein [Wenzhouxiangellaceae bacterium]|nr:flippase-like domain-containing protein [Wenzhouxiangellaceae bacterium]MBS3747986.1 flippase-like domain-containing protein [Wenzhouxiangellaceae bacterium]
MNRLNFIVRVLGLLGLALFIALIVREGIGELAASLAAAGFGLLAVAGWHVLTMSIDGLALRQLMRPRARIGAGTAIRTRWMQESVNNLLPVMQIGGNLVKVRALMRRGIATDLAGASVVIDVTLTVSTQIVFTLVGLLLLLWHLGAGDVAGSVLAGAVVMSAAIAGFYLVQKRGLFSMLTALLNRISSRPDWQALAGGAEAMDATIAALYRHRPALYQSAGLHLLAWFVGVGEVWLALYFLGTPVGLVEAILLESLGRALRTAAFAVPGAVGVQEGGFVLFAALLGLPPGAGLELSLAKRVRELVLGLPGLLAWQIEGGRAALGGLRQSGGDR